MPTNQTYTPEQQILLMRLDGIADQIKKGQFLNCHFRAFELSGAAWELHVRGNAAIGARVAGGPAGAVLADDAPVVPDTVPPNREDPPGPPDPPRPPTRRDVGSPAKGTADHVQ